MILGGDLDFSKVKRKLKNSICGIDDQAGNLAAYHDSDDRYDGIQGCGSVVRPAGISDSGCGIQLYHGTTGGSRWTACRAAGCVLIGAFDIYVVCDDIHIADDGAPLRFSTIKVITLFQKNLPEKLIYQVNRNRIMK